MVKLIISDKDVKELIGRALGLDVNKFKRTEDGFFEFEVDVEDLNKEEKIKIVPMPHPKDTGPDPSRPWKGKSIYPHEPVIWIYDGPTPDIRFRFGGVVKNTKTKGDLNEQNKQESN